MDFPYLFLTFNDGVIYFSWFGMVRSEPFWLVHVVSGTLFGGHHCNLHGLGWLSIVAGDGALGDASHSPAVCLSEAMLG